MVESTEGWPPGDRCGADGQSSSASTPLRQRRRLSALVARIRATESAADVHPVGGPRTIQAFQEIGALDRLELVVLPILLGDGLPLTPPGSPHSPLRLESHRAFPDGAIEHVYSFA
jgi:dihydrofolate reductase